MTTHPTTESQIAAIVAHQRQEIAAGTCICEFPGLVCLSGGRVQARHDNECLAHRRALRGDPDPARWAAGR